MSADIRTAFKASSPALFGYVALGLSFGFIFEQAGAVWWLAPIMSLLVYAGAAQFIAITLLSSHGSLLQLLGATFFVNLRHIFYGLSFLGRFPQQFLLKLYMIFGLTDESYSILTASEYKDDKRFCFWVILFAHSYWVIGSLIGALIGASIPIDLSFLAFTLTALFVVLTIEQAKALQRVYPFIIAGVACVLALLCFPHYMLISGIALCTLMLVVVYLASQWRAKQHG